MEMDESLDEEEIIKRLFHMCDVHKKGNVGITTLIECLKDALGNGNDEPDLLGLQALLEANSSETAISFDVYRNCIKQWIAEIRERCERDDLLELDDSTLTDDSLNFSNNNQNTEGLSGCIEISGIGDGPYRNDHEIDNLLGQLEDLKFQNGKFVEEITKLHQQLETQEETVVTVAGEIQTKRQEGEQLKKRVKSLQELVDYQQVVIDENEELKTKMSGLKEKKKELENKVTSVERENMNLQNQTRQLENKGQKTYQELENCKKDLQELQKMSLEQKDMLFQAQELRNSTELLLNEKSKELTQLKDELQELVQSNEKLEEERDTIQTALSDTESQLQRIQKRLDLYEADEGSSFSSEDADQSETGKISHSTPLIRHSIYNEIKDRLYESKQLPSPLCERFEDPIFTQPSVLPACKSTWELDFTTGSVKNYQMESENRSQTEESQNHVEHTPTSSQNLVWQAPTTQQSPVKKTCSHNLVQHVETFIDNSQVRYLKPVLSSSAGLLVQEMEVSAWTIRMRFGCLFILMGIVSVIATVCPIDSNTVIGLKHYGQPPI